MISINELLNKIKWDKELNPKEYSLFLFDRVSSELKEIKYLDIAGIEDDFLVLKDETNIPLHRIKEVRRNNKLVWER